jgi:hypothetical protein
MSYEKGTWRIARRSATALAISVAVLAMAPFTVRSEENLGRYMDRNLDVEGLILEWRSYRTYTMAVEGMVHCLAEDYCSFGPPPGFHQIIWIEVDLLAAEDRRHLLSNCLNAWCSKIVIGEVMYDSFLARKISDSTPDPHLP